MEKSNLTISLDKEDKEKFASLVQELGLNTSVAITMFIKQSIRERALPLNLRVSETNRVVDDILNQYDEAFRELAK
ncbi:MAG: type II toxin-antitoxin system RelB/DinJ family antitoxin [Peptoniphilus sp.]|nr:type II toxin-antitoxin system RelB/DinJ family antitoxin [Peptoniphilus sp.]MDY3119221.1 type II toxin-antitoxin system RelB/DinJ family antitoxin [Peptoniphilus sp.]